MPKSKGQLLQAKLDRLEALMVEKSEAVSGFSARDSNRVRCLVNLFKFYDKTNTGYIYYNDFKDVMVRFNVVGATRDIEELFNRYDEDMLGFVDYKAMAHDIYNMNVYQKPTPAIASLLDEMRCSLAGKGVQGFADFTQAVNQLFLKNADEVGTVHIDDAVSMLYSHLSSGRHFSYGVDREAFADALTCYSYHDKRQIDILYFNKVLKGGMELYRKRLVRAIFDKLDADGKGVVSEAAVRSCYRGTSGAGTLLTYLRAFHLDRRSPSADIAWSAFLDYYRCLSLALDSDSEFEETLRTSWTIPAGAGSNELVVTLSPSSRQAMTSPVSVHSVSSGSVSSQNPLSLTVGKGGAVSPVMRRVLVEHLDGTEDVVDLLDDLGTTRYDQLSLKKELQARGVTDVAAVRFR